jgi:hypothetical protein
MRGVLYDLTLGVASLTVLTTFLVMFFYFKFSRYTDSRLLNTIIALIFTDFMVGFLVLVWEGLQRAGLKDKETENHMCSVFLPFPIYFFIAGYGWTVVIALRFSTVSRVSEISSTLSF